MDPIKWRRWNRWLTHNEYVCGKNKFYHFGDWYGKVFSMRTSRENIDILEEDMWIGEDLRALFKTKDIFEDIFDTDSNIGEDLKEMFTSDDNFDFDESTNESNSLHDTHDIFDNDTNIGEDISRLFDENPDENLGDN